MTARVTDLQSAFPYGTTVKYEHPPHLLCPHAPTHDTSRGVAVAEGAGYRLQPVARTHRTARPHTRFPVYIGISTYTPAEAHFVVSQAVPTRVPCGGVAGSARGASVPRA